MSNDDVCYGLHDEEMQAAEHFAKFSPSGQNKNRNPWSEGFWTALTAIFGGDETHAQKVVDCGRKLETALVNMR